MVPAVATTPVEETCRPAGVDPEPVVAKLTALTPPPAASWSVNFELLAGVTERPFVVGELWAIEVAETVKV